MNTKTQNSRDDSWGIIRLGRMFWRTVDPVLPSVRAFGFARDADKSSNANNKDNHSQFFLIHSISTIFSHKIIDGDSHEL
jgi:hypothetical protein